MLGRFSASCAILGALLILLYMPTASDAFFPRRANVTNVNVAAGGGAAAASVQTSRGGLFRRNFTNVNVVAAGGGVAPGAAVASTSFGRRGFTNVNVAAGGGVGGVATSSAFFGRRGFTSSAVAVGGGGFVNAAAFHGNFYGNTNFFRARFDPGFSYGYVGRRAFFTPSYGYSSYAYCPPAPVPVPVPAPPVAQVTEAVEVPAAPAIRRTVVTTEEVIDPPAPATSYSYSYQAAGDPCAGYAGAAFRSRFFGPRAGFHFRGGVY